MVKLHISNRIPGDADIAGSGTTRSKVRSLPALIEYILSLSLSLTRTHARTHTHTHTQKKDWNEIH